jgi:hypothetical protein
MIFLNHELNLKGKFLNQLVHFFRRRSVLFFEFIIVPLDIQQSDAIAENDLSKSLIKLRREEFCCDLLKVSQFLLAKLGHFFI